MSQKKRLVKLKCGICKQLSEIEISVGPTVNCPKCGHNNINPAK